MVKTDLSSHTILLVDDVTFSRHTVSKLLHGMGTPTVLHAEDGEEALEVLHKNPTVDFVLSDYNMPNFNGLQLLKAIRTGKTEVKRETPFAMLTGYSDRHLVDMALALDVNAFLTKPVSQKSLSARLGKMLAQDQDNVKSSLKPADAYEDVVVEEAEEEKPVVMKVAGGVFRPPRPAPVLKNSRETKKVLSNMSSLKGKFDESDLARNITKGVDRLVTDAGSSQASRVISFIDDLVEREILELDDIPDVLDLRDADQEEPDEATRSRKAKAIAETAGGNAEESYYSLPEIPLGAILSQDLSSQDGSLFIKKGIPLTQQIVSIIAHLCKVGALKLPFGGEIAVIDPEPGQNGVLANFSPVPGETDPVSAYESESPPSERFIRAMQGDYSWDVRVRADEIPENATLARDIYTADGRLYMHAGNKLTAKFISILKDLQDLENLTSDIWIVE